MEEIQSINLITTNPEVRGGRPCIGGTGLRVIDIVMAALFHRRSPDEIATDYEVSLAAVYAALAYYYEHKEALDVEIRQLLDELAAERAARFAVIDHLREKAPDISEEEILEDVAAAIEAARAGR